LTDGISRQEQRNISYNQYPFNIFNQDLLAEQMRQKMIISEQIRHQNEQPNHILEMKKAINDFCNAAKKVSPEYQKYAMEEIMAEIMKQAGGR
jgi:hypothetical protein